jgi:asparagine synthase (glutamine-hydrolysing)
MCGIAGFITAGDDNSPEVMQRFLTAMSNAITHRGPDDEGSWSDAEAGVWLGHRRLSIVDLSNAGHQPMRSASGRYMIAFNGEIYNHLSLRQEIEAAGEAPSWCGHSDTETLLQGFDFWGIQATVERAVGMFAFAVWDRQNATLILGRDRLGEKPLYYGWQGRGVHAVFLFGSELKALRKHSAFERNVDRGALGLQLRHNCIPAPYCIYEGISKLLPGNLLSVSRQQPEPRVWTYWSVAEVAKSGVANVFSGSDRQAVDKLESLLKDSVSKQMVADVPLGAFLSGGVDSSTIVALMQAQSINPVKTFTIGFNEDNYNEAAHAKLVAQHLGTDHTELYLTAEQARSVIPFLANLYDEPFSDSSQIPMFLVSQLAQQHVSVSLSGDAGDELFCGYNRYQMTANLWRKIVTVPIPLRKLVARCLTSISPTTLDRLATILSRFMPGSALPAHVGGKLHKGAEVLSSQSAHELYSGLVSHWTDLDTVVVQGQEPPTLLTGNLPNLSGLDDVQRMMAFDMMTYLPDDILTKVDRAAMGVSLETRVPFLDHRLVEFAWSLPQSMKLRDGKSKWALRQVLYRHVPKALIERPKMGFGVPIDSWLRGPLREWAEDLLSEARLKHEGFLNYVPIRKKWTEHLSGRRNWQYQLWDVLMFQAWLEKNK